MQKFKLLVITLTVLCHTWQAETGVPQPAQPRFSGTTIPMKTGRVAQKSTTIVHSCPNMVYCQGDLLDTVQRQKLYPDSKTFVDMSQRNSEATTLANFKTMMEATGNNPSKADVRKFVNENFEFINETEVWTPKDFNPTPPFLDKIKDPTIKKFATSIVSLWPLLGRRIKDSVKADPTRHSLVPLPEGFIVPGGRFREIYYWDSYWIVKGLLISGMTDTVRGMLTNFIFLIKQYGFIPNGSRLYYINRSQPPLFTAMVGLYLEYTNDIAWLKKHIDVIETELNFWLNSRTLNIFKGGYSYQLAHYGTDSNTPRPESYAEDLHTCSYVTLQDEKNACYNALKTAAETGWDFSTRWIFDADGDPSANLSLIDSQRVVAVDLNAFLCKSFKLLSEFYGKVGNSAKQTKWASQANTWQKNIELFLYNKADGIWYDYDYDLDRQRPYFFPSNFLPLWAECYDLTNKVEQGKKAVAYFRKSGIGDFRGGIPTSLESSGEQWDMPNAWPPLQELVVMGLYKTGNQEAQAIAVDFANRWITANMKGYDEDGAMYEKYDAITPGMYGGAGEYEVQLGFGWSNGAVLSLINDFSSGWVSRASLSKYVYLTIFIFLSFLRINVRV